MRTHTSLLTVLLLTATLPAAEPLLTGPALVPPQITGREWNPRQTPVVEVVKRVRNAVVNIRSERMTRADTTEELLALEATQNRVNGMGTGIIIDPRGYIITNQHVVEDVNSLHVRMADGTNLAARVVARDRDADLALLKVDAGVALPAMPLGTASDLMVGETVVAIGNAYGYEHTVSVGVVSAVGRDVALNKEISYKALIQTDASINPGNSGGPLMNINGELIGVNVAIRAGAQGIGFAIPVDAVIKATAGMMDGKVDGTGLGLAVRDDVHTGGENGAWQRDVIVDRVDAASAAGKAGLQRGDVVIRAGDVAVASSLDLQRGFLEHIAGDHVALVVKRNGVEQKADVVLQSARGAATVAAIPTASASTDDVVWRKLGVRLRSVGAEAVASNNPQLHGGLTVTDVRADGPATKAGIQRGDVLVGLHQWEMLTQDNVLYVLNHPDLATFNPVRFFVLRGGQVHRGTVQTAD